ncbi:hypothetical protein [Clostridium sp. BJN0013]|jgi:predicted  nucleic acid-binding Zn-ribbon protein|uniref:hypothetical protein n=1 Tax=Clostridium sp. BJN0013 TaxID=3236840 RepID=UPI0034C67BF8
MEEDKVFDLMTKMYAEMQNGFKGVNEKIDSVESRLGSVESRMDSVEGRLSSVEVGVKKNSVMLEKRGGDIQLLVEWQKNLSEQMDRKFAEVNETIERNYTLHDRAIKNISKTSTKGEKAYDFIKDLSNKNFGD